MSRSIIPPEFRVPHYSARLIRGHYNYIRANYPQDAFAKIAAEIDIDPEYLIRDDVWVSDALFAKFVEAEKRLLKDPDISYKVGRHFVSPESYPPIEYMLAKNLLFPWFFFVIGAPIQYRRLNNINLFEVASRFGGNIEYVVRPKGAQKAHPDVCRNTMGMISATDVHFDVEDLKVGHPECIHRGDSHCRFIVAYRSGRFWRKRLAMIALTLGAIFTAYNTKYWLNPGPTDTVVDRLFFGAAAVAIQAAVWVGLRYRKLASHIHQYNSQSVAKAKELHENYVQLERRYQESTLLRELSFQLSEVRGPRDVIESCVENIHRRFGYGRSMAFLLNPERNRLNAVKVHGFAKSANLLYGLSLNYPTEKDAPQIFASILERGQVQLITDIAAFTRTLKPQNRSLVDALGTTSIIAAPIQDRSEKYGLLVIGTVGQEPSLTQEDASLIENLTRMMSIAFQTAKNLETESSLRSLFQKYVPAVVLDEVIRPGDATPTIGPREGKVSSIFIDLRDFTARSENMSPDAVVEMLNAYTRYVSTRIARHGGVIDKLVGDGINAFFVQQGEDQRTCVQAGLRTAADICAGIAELDAEFESRGFGGAALGIGLHFGPAKIGNMGCDLKLDFTAIGDTINLAARLQDLSKKYRAHSPATGSALALMTQTFADLAAQSELMLEDIGSQQIRGRKAPERVFLLDPVVARRWLGSAAQVAVGNPAAIAETGSPSHNPLPLSA